jgi:hypothetical protein
MGRTEIKHPKRRRPAVPSSSTRRCPRTKRTSSRWRICIRRDVRPLQGVPAPRAPHQSRAAHDRLGSNSVIQRCQLYVRFARESGHQTRRLAGPLSARNRHMHCSKNCSLFAITSSARASSTGNFWMRRRNFIALQGSGVAWPLLEPLPGYSITSSARAERVGGTSIPPAWQCVAIDHAFGRKLLLESCRRSSDVNFHFWLWAASSTNVRYRALRAAWTISVSSKSLMLRRIGTWKLMGARSIRNVIRTCASCSPRASTSIRATVIPSLGLLLRKRHPFADDFSPRLVFGLHAQDPLL